MTLFEQITRVFRTFALGRTPESDMLDNMLLEYDESLKGGVYAVSSDTTSRRRHKFSSVKRDMGIGVRRFIEIFPIMMRLQTSFSKSTRMARMPHQAEYVDDQVFVREIGSIAADLGAEALGFAEVIPDVIYAGKTIPYKYAIVVARRMDNAKIGTAPSVACMMEVMNTYGRLGILVNDLAARIIKSGYDAVPGPALGGAVDYPSLGRKAGLGEYGRHGLLISPLNGACQRLAAVFTNLKLPTDAANEHGWIWDFCSRCRKCIRTCPVSAILEEPIPQPAGHYTCVEGDRCLEYFSKHDGCSICIKECPFTTVGYGRIKGAFMKDGREFSKWARPSPRMHPIQERRPVNG